MTRLGLPGYEGLLLAIVVIQVPIVLSLRHAISWQLGQLVPMMVTVWPYNTMRARFEILGAHSAFCVFALLVFWLHLQERRARAELASSNAALLSTRAMVVEGSRQTERLRISRELHDSLGHHLTALTLQLELAQRLGAGPAVEPLERAKAISRESLGEVRRVVSQMQTPQAMDLVASVKALAGGIPSPRISVAAPEELDVGDPEASHALFRGVQEAITNAVKHAGAQHVWVELARGDQKVTAVVRDDGRGAASVKAGNGLGGMRERVAQVGGAVAFETAPGKGFTVRLEVPAK
jgi:signal transduction histidine kinase